MAVTKLAVSMDPRLVNRLDRLVKARAFRSRSQAVQVAVLEKLDRLERRRLARECAKLDPAVERALAEEGMAEELSRWPEC